MSDVVARFIVPVGTIDVRSNQARIRIMELLDPFDQLKSSKPKSRKKKDLKAHHSEFAIGFKLSVGFISKVNFQWPKTLTGHRQLNLWLL